MEITKQWLNEQDACPEGIEWFENQKETNGLQLVKDLIRDKKLSWANWLIARVMTKNQCVAYAVFAAEEVAYLWKDQYPKEYKIWKKWVDNGCEPASAAAAAEAAAKAAWAVWAASAASAAWAAEAARAASAAWAADAARAARAARAASAAGAGWAVWASGAAGAGWAAWASGAALQKKILDYGIGLLGLQS